MQLRPSSRLRSRSCRIATSYFRSGHVNVYRERFSKMSYCEPQPCSNLGIRTIRKQGSLLNTMISGFSGRKSRSRKTTSVTTTKAPRRQTHPKKKFCMISNGTCFKIPGLRILLLTLSIRHTVVYRSQRSLPRSYFTADRFPNYSICLHHYCTEQTQNRKRTSTKKQEPCSCRMIAATTPPTIPITDLHDTTHTNPTT